jgi:hypothetical protein
MDLTGHWFAQYVDGRARPLYYRQAEGKQVILGHYEIACGGCDTIGSARAVYELIGTILQAEVILCEGLLLSEDVKWSSQIADLRVLFLTTPLETCLKQIESRRKSAGNEKPLDPAKTSNRVATIEQARLRLIEAGKTCYRSSPSQAPELILKWLRQGKPISTYMSSAGI